MKNKIDQINDAFIEVLTKENARKYSEYIKAINREMIENVDSLTPAKVKEIVKSVEFNVDDIALLFVIQNAIILILQKDRPKSKMDKSLLPIIAVMGLYSLKKPKRFVEKIVKINKGIGLNDAEKRVKVILDEFNKDNAKILKDTRKIARDQFDESILKSKRSKRMVKDLREGIKENKSIAKIKRAMVRKYNKLSNVERTLDTELHSQGEFVRLKHSQAMGYTHKIWRTQGDNRVRDTHFHTNVTNKRVPIDSDFRQAGLKASQPGDTRLPPSDRIRCRCYLTFD